MLLVAGCRFWFPALEDGGRANHLDYREREIRVQGSGFRFRVQVQGSGFRVQESRMMVALES